MGGRLIGVIGLDSSGKTTLAQSLVEKFCRAGQRAVYLHFWPSLPSLPARGGSRSPSGLRKLPRWKAYALYAMTAFMIQFRLRPLLHRYDAVICDRYLYDLVTYLRLRGHDGLARRLLRGVCPDLLLWLKVDPAIVQTRKPLEYSLEVYRIWAAMYEELIQELTMRKIDIAPINANGSLEEILSQAWEAIEHAGFLQPGGR